MKYLDLQICIDEKAMYKMQYYSELASEEVGGLLEIEKQKDKLFIKDVLIMNQTASAGEFELDSEALTKFMSKMIKTSKIKKICGWWHKHPCFGWSFHDDNTFEELRSYFKGFVLGVVMQDIHQTKNKFTPLCRLDLGRVSDNRLLRNNILQFQTPYLKVIKSKKFDKRKLKQKCKKEIEKYVKEETRSYYYNGQNDGYDSPPQWDNDGRLIDKTDQMMVDEGFVYDKKSGFWVAKDENESDLVYIEGIGYNLKKEIKCNFDVDCVNCSYCDDCIDSIKSKEKRKAKARELFLYD